MGGEDEMKGGVLGNKGKGKKGKGRKENQHNNKVSRTKHSEGSSKFVIK